MEGIPGGQLSAAGWQTAPSRERGRLQPCRGIPPSSREGTASGMGWDGGIVSARGPDLHILLCKDDSDHNVSGYVST